MGLQSAYTQIKSVINTTLVSYEEIPDSIDEQDNAILYLEKGYAIAFGASNNVNPNQCFDKLRLNREIQILLSNVYSASMDADERRLAEIALLSDQESMLQALHEKTDLESNVIDFQFSQTDGVEYLNTEDKTIIISTAIFNLRYKIGE